MDVDGSRLGVAPGGAAVEGVAPGGATAGVGAACGAVADHLAGDGRFVPSVWLERGGRLRCVAGSGVADRPAAISPDDGVVGRTYAAGRETVVADLAASRTAGGHHAQDLGTPDGAVAEVCVPLRCDDRVVGVLDVRFARPLRAGDLDTLRGCAAELGERIAELGGAPADTPAWRTLRRIARLSALDDAGAIARGVLAAAIELTALDSGAVACRRADGSLGVAALAGPLGAALGGLPAGALDAMAASLAEGATSFVAASANDDVRPEFAALRGAGAEAFVAVVMTARDEAVGLALLAGPTPARLSADEAELLGLLAEQGGSCLGTAELVRSLRRRAATDPLTGLGHHATFHEALSGAHRRPSTAVVVCDLDGFKRLNDCFGHQHGDRVLRGVAAALTSALRRGDRLYRIGGDEFAALLLVSDAAEALEAGTRLRVAVEDAALGVSVSVGIAVPRDGESDAGLLARADRALYRAKAGGHDGVALADDDPLPVAPPL
ncbi:MAG: hypothetical protein QOD81_4149, partial [Solirubrobacteraceae bacterium]|nr:hypothetical protein [Solirubrobacteraceae bacterium]